MEYRSGRNLGAMAMKSINFKGMVLGYYKGYDNELWNTTFRMPYGDWIKILGVHDL
jgi:hypothetical protein